MRIIPSLLLTITALHAAPGDPLAQQAFLKASNPGYINNFGYSVAVDGDIAVVGARNEDSNATGVNGNQADGSAYGAGAVYVFTRTAGVWTQQAYLKASNTEGNDNFGSSVAVSGDTIVVGAPGEDSSAIGVGGNQGDNSAGGSGAVYVFTHTAGVWSQQAYVKASNTGAGDGFGYSVSLSGDSLIVGSPSRSSNTGAAYVFTRSAGVWSQQTYLQAGNAETNDSFGWSVALDGDTAAVGARGEASNAIGVNAAANGGSGTQADNSLSFAGAAYVFTRNAGSWSQQAYLKAGNTGASDQFGWSVAVDQDTVVVGALGEASNATGVNAATTGGAGTQEDNSASFSGAAYVFTRSAGTWSQQAYLKASNSEASDYFGISVAVTGDTVAVGASGEDSAASGINGNQADNSAYSSGASYVFVRTAGSWNQESYLKSETPAGGDQFGCSVSASWDTVVVGAYGKTGDPLIPSTSSEGAAYVFTPPPPVPMVTGIDPASGSVAGGTEVTITGSYFSGAFTVNIGNQAATNVTVINDSTITATTPPGVEGPANVLVGTPAGINEPNSLFTYFLPAPDIAVATSGPLTDGVGNVAFASIGDPGPPLTFTITNPGTADLTDLAVAITGPDADNFTPSALSATSVPVGPGSVTFTVTFTPSSSAPKSAALQISSNVTGLKNPFDIALTGQTLLFTEDFDNDGLSDASEFQLAALGFDWQVAQPGLVQTYFATAAGAGLFKPTQVQGLKLPAPRFRKDPNTGEYILTIGVETSTPLQPDIFNPFPLTDPQTINGGGKLELQLATPDDAEFLRLNSQ